MLNEDSKKILVTMSEMIFYQEKDISELKCIKENLVAHLNQKKEALEEMNKELKRRVLEINSLNEKIKILEEDLQKKESYPRLKKELKEKDELLKTYEEELKKYRKDEKKREEISKALGETIKGMKNKE